MGSLSKRMGQVAARSLESESSQILRTIASNKIPNSLSQRLDTTLKDSHDVKVFGLGTLADLMGGQVLGTPTRLALGLNEGRPRQIRSIISEARTAFKCNINVYSEEPMWIESALGLKNIALGYFRSS